MCLKLQMMHFDDIDCRAVTWQTTSPATWIATKHRLFVVTRRNGGNGCFILYWLVVTCSLHLLVLCVNVGETTRASWHHLNITIISLLRHDQWLHHSVHGLIRQLCWFLLIVNPRHQDLFKITYAVLKLIITRMELLDALSVRRLTQAQAILACVYDITCLHVLLQFKRFEGLLSERRRLTGVEDRTLDICGNLLLMLLARCHVYFW